MCGCVGCVAVIIALCTPSSAGVSPRASTTCMPETAKIESPAIASVPVNGEPSDVFTVAVAITKPAGALSGIFGEAGSNTIAIGAQQGRR